MEINPKHGIVRELKKLMDKDPSSSTFKDLVWLLYDTSLLNSGFSIEDPNSFAKRMHKMLLCGLQDEPETSQPEVKPTTETTAKVESKNSYLDDCD